MQFQSSDNVCRPTEKMVKVIGVQVVENLSLKYIFNNLAKERNVDKWSITLIQFLIQVGFL